jgi:hypothetical protein
VEAAQFGRGLREVDLAPALRRVGRAIQAAVAGTDMVLDVSGYFK